MYNTQTGGEEVGQFRVAVRNVQGIVMQSSKDLCTGGGGGGTLKGNLHAVQDSQFSSISEWTTVIIIIMIKVITQSK